MSGKIPNTPDIHQHRERSNPLSRLTRAGLAQKSSVAQRKVPVTMKPLPWKKGKDRA